MKINYILCIKFSIITRYSLQNAVVRNGTLHTGGEHLHGRISSPREGVWAHKASLSIKRFIELQVQTNQGYT